MIEEISAGIGGDIPGRMGIKEGPVGLGGWLIFPPVHLLTASIVLLLLIFGMHMAQVTEGWHTGAQLLSIPLFAGVLLIYTVVCLVRFFRLKKNVPMLMIGYYVVSGIFYALTLHIGGAIASIIWIIYFIRSKRVKNTFLA